MSSNPKIMIIRFREIVYTLILIFLVFFLLFCLVLMFRQNSADDTRTGSQASMDADIEDIENTENIESIKGTEVSDEESQTDSAEKQKLSSAGTSYTAGVYASSFSIGDSFAEVQVTVSSNSIQSIELVNLSEETAASYPLLSSSLEGLASQILEKQKLEGITCSATNRYTSQLLYHAISAALSKASETNE
ncbi:MAG: hypothetical protein LUI87_15250 [Lachnospiraceae bacterium]|nr:hypothetical protein [Lachnospiraceae bacterium]